MIPQRMAGVSPNLPMLDDTRAVALGIRSEAGRLTGSHSMAAFMNCKTSFNRARSFVAIRDVFRTSGISLILISQS